jgi:RIO-like serine/threonine protein kinase
MRNYPGQMTIENDLYYYEKILKDDFFSVNVLYRSSNEGGKKYVLKLSDFRFIFGWLFFPFAVYMSRREYKIYSMVKDIQGIPKLGPKYGLRGYFHEFIEGRTLHELASHKEFLLPDDFFARLKAIVDEIHRRRIFYMDLNKHGNIIISDDGSPYLIDFQISLYLGRRNFLCDRLFNFFIREDIYHIYKHKKRFRPDLMTEEEKELARRTKLGKGFNLFFGRPYRKVKRLIYPAGSNEIIWYKWKKMKDKSKRMS